MIYKKYVISRPGNEKGLSWYFSQDKKGIKAIISISKYPEYRILYLLAYGVGDDFIVLLWEKERGERKDFLKIYHFKSGEKNVT